MTIETELPAVKVGDGMAFFTANVDRWGAAEWFDRLAKAIREQDNAVRAKDDISFEIFRSIAASSAMTLVREFEEQVRSALTLKDDPGNGAEADPVTRDDLSHFIRDKAESHKGMLQPDFWPFLAMYLMEEFSIRRGKGREADG